MQSLKKSLIVAGGLVALGSIGTIMNHAQNPAALRADDEGEPKVTIAAPLPLPVNVNNTPNVHVTNSPTVQVGNTSSSPVLTRSVDEPFQFAQSGTQMNFTFPVPAGKTLVIEHISLACFEPTASLVETDFRLFATVNGVVGFYYFAPAHVLGSPGLTTLLTANQVTHIYATGGTTVLIGNGFGIPAGANCEASVTGHLVGSL